MKKEQIIEKIQAVIRKYREVFLYIFFGFCAFLVNFGVFSLFYYVCNLDELWANAIAWIIAVIFAFWTNRLFVFQKNEKGTVFLQFCYFSSARIASLLVEELLLFLLIKKAEMNAAIVKVITQIIVTILNYFSSKFFVFR